jgi:hypothetical protein
VNRTRLVTRPGTPQATASQPPRGRRPAKQPGTATPRRPARRRVSARSSLPAPWSAPRPASHKLRGRASQLGQKRSKHVSNTACTDSVHYAPRRASRAGSHLDQSCRHAPAQVVTRASRTGVTDRVRAATRCQEGRRWRPERTPRLSAAVNPPSAASARRRPATKVRGVSFRGAVESTLDLRGGVR